MFGKHFASMYTGSMVGAGAVVFALMGYVIANQRPDRIAGAQVELNPKLLATILGEPEDKVRQAIEFLCSPDPHSRSKDEEGRRLIRLGEFDYRVVNGPHYRKILDEEARREYNRLAKQKERLLKKGHPLPGENAFVAALKDGRPQEELDRMSEPISYPEKIS